MLENILFFFYFKQILGWFIVSYIISKVYLFILVNIMKSYIIVESSMVYVNGLQKMYVI